MSDVSSPGIIDSVSVAPDGSVDSTEMYDAGEARAPIPEVLATEAPWPGTFRTWTRADPATLVTDGMGTYYSHGRFDGKAFVLRAQGEWEPFAENGGCDLLPDFMMNGGLDLTFRHAGLFGYCKDGGTLAFASLVGDAIDPSFFGDLPPSDRVDANGAPIRFQPYSVGDRFCLLSRVRGICRRADGGESPWAIEGGWYPLNFPSAGPPPGESIVIAPWTGVLGNVAGTSGIGTVPFVFDLESRSIHALPFGERQFYFFGVHHRESDTIMWPSFARPDTTDANWVLLLRRDGKFRIISTSESLAPVYYAGWPFFVVQIGSGLFRLSWDEPNPVRLIPDAVDAVYRWSGPWLCFRRANGHEGECLDPRSPERRVLVGAVPAIRELNSITAQSGRTVLSANLLPNPDDGDVLGAATLVVLDSDGPELVRFPDDVWASVPVREWPTVRGTAGDAFLLNLPGAPPRWALLWKDPGGWHFHIVGDQLPDVYLSGLYSTVYTGRNDCVVVRTAGNDGETVLSEYCASRG